jgi:hypothetical protein
MALLRAEFGEVILETLMSLPKSEIQKGRNKQARCEGTQDGYF